MPEERKKLTRPRALLFDWDNTLVDTWPCIGRATNITLEAMGHKPWTPAEVRQRVAGSLRDVFPGLFGDRWEEAREIFYRAFEEVHLDVLVAAAGTEAMLKDSAKSGLYLGVVSNKTGKYLRAEADHLGWTGLFGRLVGAQDAARDKPAPDPVHLALLQSGIPAGPEVWFVGDAPIDVTCGRAAGCSTIYVGEPPHGVTELPDYAVADCAALAGLVRASL